jgi:hypothetical protein
MSKSNTWENDLLLLLFNNTTASGIGDGTGLVGSSTAGSLYVSLHTGDPGESGTQQTSECGYTSYARVAVARNGSNWVVTNNEVVPAAAITFPTCTGGSENAGYFGIGTASSGAGKLLYSGTISPSITIANTVTPVLNTGTKITED